MGTTVDSLDIQIKASVEQSSKALDKLAEKLNTLQKGLSNIGSITSKTATGTTRATSNINTSFTQTNTTINKINSGWSNFTKSIATAGVSISALTITARRFKKVFEELYEKVDVFAEFSEKANFLNVSIENFSREYFGEMGYNSAEEFSEKFYNRINNKLQEMSGLKFDASGILSPGVGNLGADIGTVSDFNAQLLTLSQNMNLSAASGYALSESFTGIAADLASLRGMDYKTVSENLVSGLTGSTKVLRKYGIDISNAGLKVVAMNHGITTQIEKLSQSEKVQLRILAILEQTRTAYGNQNIEINSLHNQLNILKTNFNNLSLQIGQIFAPVLANSIPYINAFAVAIQRLLYNIAKFLKISDTRNNYATSGVADALSDIEEEASGANSSVKSLNKQLLGIDEINNLSDSKGGTGTGGLLKMLDLTKEITDATKNYNDIWEKTAKNIQQKTDLISKYFEPITTPFANLDWSTISENISKLSTALEPWIENLGKGFVEFWGDMAKISADAIDKIFGKDGAIVDLTNWLNKNDPERAKKWGYSLGILSLGLLSFGALAGVTGTLMILGKVLGFVFSPIKALVGLGSKVAGLFGLTAALESLGGLGGLLTMDLAVIFGAGTAAEIGLTIGVGIIGGILAAWGGFNFGKILGKLLNPDDKQWYDNFKFFGEDGFFKTITKDIESTLQAWSELTNDWENNPIIASLGTFFVGGLKKIDPPPAETLKEAFEEGKTAVLEKFSEIGEAIGTWLEEDVKPWFTKEKWSGIFSGIGNAFESIWDGITKVFKEKWNMFADWLNEKLTIKIDTSNLIGLGISTLLGSDKIRLVDIPKFKYGGFPEDGLFMANHNELVGQFSNGKTAVANNEQIISGIEGGVERAVSRVLAPYLADIADSSRRTASKEFGISRKQAFNAVREEAKIFRQTTGSPAF